MMKKYLSVLCLAAAMFAVSCSSNFNDPSNPAYTGGSNLTGSSATLSWDEDVVISMIEEYYVDPLTEQITTERMLVFTAEGVNQYVKDEYIVNALGTITDASNNDEKIAVLSEIIKEDTAGIDLINDAADISAINITTEIAGCAGQSFLYHRPRKFKLFLIS